jgi:hypothetical protein
MAYANWSGFLRRKSRTSRADAIAAESFVTPATNDTVDWGNGKSYKFNGKRWKRIDEADELEVDLEAQSQASLPAQTTAVAGQFLKTDGTDADWSIGVSTRVDGSVLYLRNDGTEA